MNSFNFGAKKTSLSADGQPYLAIGIAKVVTFFESANFSKKFSKNFFDPKCCKRTLRPPVSERGRKGSYFFLSCKFFRRNFYIIPPAGIAGAAGAGSGMSTIPHSVVRNMPATEAAFSSATRETLVGSITPASNIFTYSPVRAL